MTHVTLGFQSNCSHLHSPGLQNITANLRYAQTLKITVWCCAVVAT